MTPSCVSVLLRAFVAPSGKYTTGLLSHKHTQHNGAEDENPGSKKQSVSSQTAATQRFQETVFWRIVKVSGGKVGWLEGIDEQSAMLCLKEGAS